ncbi:MAG: hypothetical protein ACRD0S_02870, partial [Acidimicrobiales bacterium]
MTSADDNDRISKLRALIGAEGGQPAGLTPPPREPDQPGTPTRSPLVLAVGAGAVIAVVVGVLLVLGGDSEVKQPEGTTSRRVSVFPTRMAGGIEEGEKVTICDDKAGGALAPDVMVFGLGEEKVPLYGRTVLIDVYIPDDLAGRFQGRNLGDFAVVQGSCGEVSSTTTTTTSPPATVPATAPPADPTVPTQPPDQG